MRNNTLLKGIVTIFIANVINLVFSLFNGFILPKYLSIESYASIKTFQLYLSYIGLLHLGFADGAYLLYGGRQMKSLDPAEIGRERGTLLAMQLIASAAAFAAGWCLGDKVLCVVALTIIPYNVTNYYKLLYQATGEFRDYSNVMNITSGLLFLCNVVLLLIVRSDEGMHYLIAYLVSYTAIWLFVALWFKHRHLDSRLGRPSVSTGNQLVKSGFALMMGNFSSIILTSEDRWFVKLLMSTLSFAQYSFAVSIENLLAVVVTPISTTLYNFFCTQRDSAQYQKMQDFTMIFATIIVASAFPVKFIIEHYIQNYVGAIEVLYYLFAANIFLTVVKCFYVNLYKARKMQKKYFARLLTVIIVGLVLNAALYMLLKTKEALAVATMISSILWFVMCRMDFGDIRAGLREYLYLALHAAAFLFAGIRMSAVYGMLAYLGCWIGLSALLMRSSMRFALQMVSSRFRKTR